MPKAIGWLPAVLLAIPVVTGCNSSSSSPLPSLTVTAEVSRDIDVGGGMATGGGSQPEYAVIVHVKNKGDSPATLSQITAEWVPHGGRALTASQKFVAEGAGTIPNGEEKVFTYRSDGYTQDLLTSSDDGSLAFRVTLFSGDAAVVGPLQAPLPKMQVLPSLGSQPTPLEFTGRPIASSDARSSADQPVPPPSSLLGFRPLNAEAPKYHVTAEVTRRLPMKDLRHPTNDDYDYDVTVRFTNTTEADLPWVTQTGAFQKLDGLKQEDIAHPESAADAVIRPHTTREFHCLCLQGTRLGFGNQQTRFVFTLELPGLTQLCYTTSLPPVAQVAIQGQGKATPLNISLVN